VGKRKEENISENCTTVSFFRLLLTEIVDFFIKQKKQENLNLKSVLKIKVCSFTKD
jgi:hypothetical protein